MSFSENFGLKTAVGGGSFSHLGFGDDSILILSYMQSQFLSFFAISSSTFPLVVPFL